MHHSGTKEIQNNHRYIILFILFSLTIASCSITDILVDVTPNPFSNFSSHWIYWSGLGGALRMPSLPLCLASCCHLDSRYATDWLLLIQTVGLSSTVVFSDWMQFSRISRCICFTLFWGRERLSLLNFLTFKVLCCYIKQHII